MKKKILSTILIITMLLGIMYVLTGCKNNENVYSDTENSNSRTTVHANTVTDSQGNIINLTTENVSTYYGREVNYTANDSDTAVWRLFYVDFEGKYGEKNTIYLKADPYSTVEFNEKKFKTYESSDLTIMKKMNQDWAEKDGTVDHIYERFVSYLCDTQNWKNFANDDANYAIGAPSVEMYIDSYNQSFGTNYAYYYADRGYMYSYADGGYMYSTDGGENWKYTTGSVSLLTEKNNLYAKRWNDYWLASVSARGGICKIENGNESVHLGLNWATNSGYVCPVVSLKSGVTIKLKE